MPDLVYVVRQNVDNADVSSVHRTLDGAKSAAERAAGEPREGFEREWAFAAFGAVDLVERGLRDVGGGRRGAVEDLLYSVTPFALVD